jgi:hypothetical protein
MVSFVNSVEASNSGGPGLTSCLDRVEPEYNIALVSSRVFRSLMRYSRVSDGQLCETCDGPRRSPMSARRPAWARLAAARYAPEHTPAAKPVNRTLVDGGGVETSIDELDMFGGRR